MGAAPNASKLREAATSFLSYEIGFPVPQKTNYYASVHWKFLDLNGEKSALAFGFSSKTQPWNSRVVPRLTSENETS